MQRPIPLLAATALFLLASGCNAPGPRSTDAPPLGWLAARGADFMDLLELNVGAGTGLFAAAEVAPIRVGYGWSDTSRLGMMGRSAGVWDEYRAEFFILHQVMHWQKTPRFGNAFLFDVEETQRHNAQVVAFAKTEPQGHPPEERLTLDSTSRLAFYEEWGWISRYQDHERPWLDVTAEVTVLFLSVDVGFSPQETFDFLFGIFGIDAISHDDRAAIPVDVVEEDS